MNKNFVELAKKTHQLSNKLVDYSCIEKINSVHNVGKRVQMCVSTTLILDTLSAYAEYCKSLDQDLIESKVSRSLLTRYIYESYVNFLYIFAVKKGEMQTRAKAFYHYGDYKKVRLQKKDELKSEEEWRKYVSKKSRGSQWHGKTFKDICEEVKYSNTIYQILSQFTHPGIFTLERISNSDLFKGIIEDSILFTSSSVCDMLAHANKLKLYGLKQNQKNEKEIKYLVLQHSKFLENLKNKN